MKPEIKPVITPPRKVPHSIKPELKEELQRMERLGIIERVDTPTDWVISMVVTEKANGKLRICLDSRSLNQIIKRHDHQIPTAQEIFSKIGNTKVFSQLDASSGYWQVPDDGETSNLLTFATPFRRYKFKRMPYGIHSASEVFQLEIADIIDGIENAEVSQNDIIIWGENQEQHDQTVRKVLNRNRANGLKFNKSKCVFSFPELTFLGHVISKDGIKVDPKKVEAISNMALPTSKVELQRLLGMINYLGMFIPNLSEVTYPRRILLENDNEFKIQQPQIDTLPRSRFS